MNWKTTIAFGILFSGLGGYYLFSGTSTGPGGTPELPSFPALERLVRIDITRKGQPEIVLEQQPDAVTGIKWKLTKPIERLANDALVLDMGQALAQIRRGRGIQKGDVNYDLPKLGLEAPALVVGFNDGITKTTLKFGNRSTLDPTLRYFMVDGDDLIYLCRDVCATPFEKSLLDLRNRGLARFEAFRVMKIELASRFEVARQIFVDGKPVMETAYTCDKCGKGAAEPGACPVCKGALKMRQIPKYEKRVENDMATLTLRKDGARGWYLTSRNGQATDERLDDSKVTHAVTVLSNLACGAFSEKEDPKKYGLDQPEVRYRLWLDGLGAPVEVSLAPSQQEGKRTIAGRVGGTDEIGLLDPVRQYDQIYKHVDQMRTHRVFEMTKDQITALTIETNIAKLRLVPLNKERQPGPPVWAVAEPKAFLMLTPEELDKLVDRLLALEIKTWIPMQEDKKLFGLGDKTVKPDIRVTVEVRRSADVVETLEFDFGNKQSEDAYLLRPKGTEICVVPGDYVTMLDRCELLARNKEIFHCNQRDVFEIAVEFRQTGIYAAQYYRLTNASGKWAFGNADMTGVPVDQPQFNMLLAAVNWIEAESYITRRADVAKDLQIAGAKAPGRLIVKYRVPDGGQREVALNISEPQSAAGGGEVYHAKFESIDIADDRLDPFYQIVFRPKRQLIDVMRKGVKLAKPPDEGTDPNKKPDKHEDDHK